MNLIDFNSMKIRPACFNKSKSSIVIFKIITKITFTSKNGSNTETTNTKLINFLLDSAKEPPKEDCYETFKLVKMDQIIDNIYLQSKFYKYKAEG